MTEQTDTIVASGVRRDHINDVTISCDNQCGRDFTGLFQGENFEVRWATARKYLADTQGWKITKDQDLCPVCSMPQQPDGISEQSRDLPDPRLAAERVDAYIEACGDGLYDVQAGKPLYARDLAALVRLALAADKAEEQRA